MGVMLSCGSNFPFLAGSTLPQFTPTRSAQSCSVATAAVQVAAMIVLTYAILGALAGRAGGASPLPGLPSHDALQPGSPVLAMFGALAMLDRVTGGGLSDNVTWDRAGRLGQHLMAGSCDRCGAIDTLEASALGARVAGASRTSGVATPTPRSITVLRPGLFTTVQDAVDAALTAQRLLFSEYRRHAIQNFRRRR